MDDVIEPRWNDLIEIANHDELAIEKVDYPKLSDNCLQKLKRKINSLFIFLCYALGIFTAPAGNASPV